MKVVLDTNVLISALISPHNPPDLILQSWLAGDFELLTSEDQLEERLFLKCGRKLAFERSLQFPQKSEFLVG